MGINNLNRLINKISIALFSIPGVKSRWARTFQSIVLETIPWTPLLRPLSQCKVALLTTGGVHLKPDKPFNMEDKNGDPSYRKIPSGVQGHELMTTHDYYDHRDADRDINLVFPIDILRVCQHDGLLGKSADNFYSFMGHIKGPHLKTLVKETAKEVAELMKQESVDVAILVPS